MPTTLSNKSSTTDQKSNPSGSTAEKISDLQDLCLTNSVAITHTDKDFFERMGFLKISQFLTDTSVSALREVANQKIETAESIGATYGNTFSKLSYGLGKFDIFKAIYTSNGFKKAIGELVGMRLIATESNGFELSPGKTGFPWHYGSLSFRYIRPEDMGYSVWFPLDPINPDKQGGGMAYIPQSYASCALNYQMSAILTKLKLDGKVFDEVTESLGNIFGFSGRFTTDLFECNKIEDSFAVGDALIFNKNIWHRSSPLREGPLQGRLAVNMRFVDWRSRLDLKRYEGEAETGGGLGLGVDFGHQRQTTFGSHFIDINDGDELRDSIYCGEII